jgi:hypothetical protein
MRPLTAYRTQVRTEPKSGEVVVVWLVAALRASRIWIFGSLEAYHATA